MTMQNIPGIGVYIPTPPYYSASGFSFTATLIDASTEKIAFIGRVETKDRTAKSIRKVGYLAGTVSLNASSTITTSIQSVSTTTGPPAQPSGTVLGATNNGTVTEAAATFSTNTWHQTGALGEDVSVSYGDLIAVVVEYGTFTAADALNLRHLSASSSVQHATTLLFTGSWASQTVNANIILEFSDGTFGTLAGALPMSAIAAATYNSGTGSADEYALEFSAPFPIKVDGAMLSCYGSSGSSDFEIILYSGTTALETVAIDGNTLGTTSGTRPLHVVFSQAHSLSANTTYRIALRPTTANAVNLHIYDVASAGHLDAHSLGASCCLATRLDSGAWSTVSTRRPLIFVKASAFDDGAGGGGGNTYSRGRIVNQ